jgi:hypothetical protein
MRFLNFKAWHRDIGVSRIPYKRDYYNASFQGPRRWLLRPGERLLLEREVLGLENNAGDVPVRLLILGVITI